MLRYTVTPAILPPDVPIQLNTETFTDWAPDMEARYPNTPMELGLRVTGAAGVTVDPESTWGVVPVSRVRCCAVRPSPHVPSFARVCPRVCARVCVLACVCPRVCPCWRGMMEARNLNHDATRDYAIVA